MTLNIELIPEQEVRLIAVAQRDRLDPAEVVKTLLAEHVPPLRRLRSRTRGLRSSLSGKKRMLKKHLKRSPTKTGSGKSSRKALTRRARRKACDNSDAAPHSPRYLSA